jgi:hypothetical protein
MTIELRVTIWRHEKKDQPMDEQQKQAKDKAEKKVERRQARQWAAAQAEYVLAMRTR